MILPCTYLDRLQYHGHDRERSRPVHLHWKLLDWPKPDAVCARIRLRLEDEFEQADRGERPVNVPLNPFRDRLTTNQKALWKKRHLNPLLMCWVRESRRCCSVLLVGVAQQKRKHEQSDWQVNCWCWNASFNAFSTRAGPGLAEKVLHTAKIGGDGAGFDIRSFFPDGRLKFIEVKTTTGPKDTDFLISANEVAFSAARQF